VGAWVIAGVITDMARRVGGGGVGRLFKLPLAVWGMAIAHVGVGLFAIGATVETTARSEQTFPMHVGDTVKAYKWTFRFDGVSDGEGPNYFTTRADITATHDGITEVLHPEKRFYPVAQQATTEASITRTSVGHVYLVLGDTIREQPGLWRIRVA